ncbi:hypothetical protein Moror_556 [Moniliophthora roreri MCA 2997]|uniref:AAA protein C-terminal winged helix domain-containing protein n=1 Tax=Moniliophthora roreri (strain MCA 2997) TaxID=1381753 RepID=V2WX53_MONRO|nr:hypothetical protein Moror_556 [Moniliophthora roreri MCA 2997]
MNNVGFVSRGGCSTILKLTVRRIPSTRSLYSTLASKDPSDSSATTLRKPQPPVLSHPKTSRPRPAEDHKVGERILFERPGTGSPNFEGTGSNARVTRSPLLDVALSTIVGLGVVFVGGIVYLQWYKANVLNKIEIAFAPGYDPTMEVATNYLKESTSASESSEVGGASWTQYFRRNEQDLIDRIIRGEEHGYYYILLGPKGSGKERMIFDATDAIQADGVSICEAHPDLEVFRLRLGRALNYEFNEDLTNLFQRRDPREGGPALDIERALNKLEKVALRCVKQRGKPLVLIVTNVHHFNNDNDGRNILLLLQQRAESWARCGIVSIMFTMDNFWPFYVMHKPASRMHVVSIFDFAADVAVRAVTAMRLEMKHIMEDPSEITGAVSIVGGRLSYLNKIAGSRNVKEMADHLLKVEKAWLLSQIGFIVDCDSNDNAIDEQKWSSCSWLLLQEFVKLRQEQERENPGINPLELPLPFIPYWRCRQIMTRADFLEELDRKNIIFIDEHHNVRPDSMLILNAARQVVEAEGFRGMLRNVRNRINEIESGRRTRELTFKDLKKGGKIHLVVDKGQRRL